MTEYHENTTYGNLIDKYIPNAEWTAFNYLDTDTAVVEINGTSIADEVICIQFCGEGGMGFNNVNIQQFTPYYFEIDGEPYDYDAAFAYIYLYVCTEA